MPQQVSGHRLFLIGSEATTAMSPGLWNPVLTELDSGWHYEGWNVPAFSPMDQVHTRLLQDDVVAANVTMPHKHWAAGVADRVSTSVELSGAANVLIRRGNELDAHNTDVAAIQTILGGRHDRHVLMMGAGGAARAALVAVHGQAEFVTVTDRDPQAAGKLLAVARELGMRGQVLSWAQAQSQSPGASLIVNATPLGKRAGDGPVWGGSPLAPDALVYDFVYASHVTASISCARSQGVRSIDGWEHLLHQAAAMVPLLQLSDRAYGLLGDELARLHTSR